MTVLLLAVILSAGLLAKSSDHPTGNRTTPPTIASVSPHGVARGMTAEMTVEGLNLAGASAIYFSEPGVQGRILREKELPDKPEAVRLGAGGLPSTVDLGPLPPRNQITIELEVSAGADVGPVDFRLQTPLGTSPTGRFLIEPYYGESPDREPNDTPETAFETFLPTILVGKVSRAGDADYYEIAVQAGEELVFANGGDELGSALDLVISILDDQQTLIREQGGAHFAHRFNKPGTHYIRVSDYQWSGGNNHVYRIKVGKFPLAVSTFPLGFQRGRPTELNLQGYNLGPEKARPPTVEVTHASPSDTITFRPDTPAGRTFNELKLAVGEDPEVVSSGQNVSVANARPVSVPVIINGYINAPKGAQPAAHHFRFHARKGEKLVLEVNAHRLGSELDSVIEVLDANGEPIERATVRAVHHTFTCVREHDSAARGIRILSKAGFSPGDYVMIGAEIIRLEAPPAQPDGNMIFESFNGRRLAFFDTTTESHGIDKPVYKVEMHPPGAQFTNNGLPLVRLYYRNDDGGPGYGKDSRLRFTAPATGDYVARLHDVRGLGGERHSYRLTIREPRHDFRLSVNPKNPNVPRSARIPLTVSALRLDDFDGPIEVSLVDLPAGLYANDSVILPGQHSTTLLLGAEKNARLDRAVPLKVIGRARIGDRHVTHLADPDELLKLISLMPEPDILMSVETREVVLETGRQADVTVRVKRQNGFHGRIPLEVRNLPPGVQVSDVGLNGILITENEDRRTFLLERLPTAKPTVQPIYVSGKIETRSSLQSSYAAEPILLKVLR